jgi:Response regulator containing a CheY-like receiver domain and an HTH DNA-binding domain
MNDEAQSTVLVVDDHPIFRHGLCDLIEKHPEFAIVGEASDGEEALNKVAALTPKIIILDIDMPRLSGLKTIRALRERSISVLPVVLTMYREEGVFNAAMDLGTKAYVLKENAVTDVILALEKVNRGEVFLSKSMSAAARRRGDKVRDLLMMQPQIESLTQAERRILKLISEDLTSKEIADHLNLSCKTIENHRYNICLKLNLHGTHSLLRFAFDHRASL